MKKSILNPLLVRLTGAFLLSLTGYACSGVAGTPESQAPPKPVTTATPAPVAASGPASLMQQLQAAVGNAACDSAAQCKTVAIGHKACGGPESYMAYSTRSDSARITALAEQYAAARRRENESSGMMSTCQMVRDPGATCSAGRCVTAQGGPGGVSER